MRFFSFLFWMALLAAVLPQSKGEDSAIHEITVGIPVPVPDNSGDTWVPAWTRDGSIYTPSNDTNGFHGKGGSNIAFNRIVGEAPVKATGESELNGETINYMSPDYGSSSQQGPDGRTWKSSGCLALDGVIYWVIARHAYGGQQTAQNSSIIKSLDNGKTWTRSVKENLAQPMFPGNEFATPYFVNYGQEGHEGIADHSDQ